MIRRGLLVLLAAVFGISAKAAEIKTLEVKKESGRYIITADCLVDAPIKGIFDVLTDYERFHELSSMITESRFVEPDETQGNSDSDSASDKNNDEVSNSNGHGNDDSDTDTHTDMDKAVVFTRTEGCVLFFCKTIDKTELMETIPDKEVVTTAIPEHSDVDFSQATWTLQEDSGKTRLQYELRTDLGFWVPPIIGPMVVRRAWYNGSERALNRLEEFAQERTRTSAL